ILGSVQTLQRRELDPEVQTDFLETIERQGRRLLRLIEDILDVQRAASGPQLVTGPVELADVVSHVVRAQAGLGREVSTRVPVGLVVHADSEALERVLINLVDNGFVHGSGPVEVEAVDEGGGYVRLSVLDRGA